MEKIKWKNGETPLNDTNLNQMQDNIEKSCVVVSPTEPTTNESVWIKKGKNKFNKNAVLDDYYLDSTGALVVGTAWVVSNFMEVEPNKKYSYQGLSTAGTAPYSAYYDKDKNFISSFKQATGINTIIIPENAYYVRFSICYWEEVQTDIDNFQFEQGSTATDYEEFIEEKILIKNSAGVFEEYSDIKVGPVMPTQGKVWIKKGKNLFNKNSGIVSGSFLGSDGSIGTDTNLFYQNTYIPVLPNTTYTISSSIGESHRIVEYDKDKTFIKRNLNANTSNIYSFTTSSNCYFLRISCNISNLDTIQLEQNSTATVYEEYIEKEIYVKNDNGVFEKFVSDSQKAEIISGSDSNVTINETYIKTLKYANYEKSGSLVHYHFSAITQEISSAINYLIFFENLKYRPINAGIVYLTEQTASQGITSDMIICQTRPNGELRFKTSNAIAEGQYLIFDLMYFTND